jgi:Zn-dependent M28 family amino/carboxypeptidase
VVVWEATVRTILCALFLGGVLLAQGPGVDEKALRAHLAFLADDVLEGRGTGQRGGELAVRYLETQLQVMGLQPANGASYRQTVRLAGIRLDSSASGLRFEGASEVLSPELGTDLVMGAGAAEPALAVDAPLVFVGHGITAQDGSRDDYKGLDVRGKVLVMLVGDRHEGPPMPLCCEPENFYGRWTYKFEEARRRGAAGALLVHTTPSAGYGWPVVRNGWVQERFQREGAGHPGAVQGWITEGQAGRLFAASGLDFKALAKGADSLAFHPVALPVRAKGQLVSAVRRLEQWNVAGVLPGTDPELRKELVIYSAHWDHFGKGADGAIYAGAVDNGTGCAAVLALAQALVHRSLKRSVMFFFPCAEEQGLLGASAYVAAPLWPLERTVLNVNLESLNVVGPTRDIGLLGSKEPRLRALCEQAAAATGLAITPAKADPAGLCFRSDHFPFMKAGVPALSPGFSLDGGWDYLGDKAAAQAKAADFLNHYHRPTDRYDPAWNLAGLMQQVRFALELGRLAGTVPTAR